MEKKNIINAICCLVLVASSLTVGYFLGRRGSSVLQPDSTGIESGIIAIGDGLSSAESSISNGIVILNGNLELGQLANTGLESLQSINEKQRVYIDEIKREIENSIRITEDFKSANSGISDATEYALELAIADAEEYERLIGVLQSINSTYSENTSSK